MIPYAQQKKHIKDILKYKGMTLWAGSIRSGKTTAGGMASILHSLTRDPGAQYIVAGKSYSTVCRNVVIPMRKIARSWGLYENFARSEQTLRINNSDFFIFGANNESSQDKIQGMTADGFFLDELTLLPQSFFMQAIGRCSTKDPMMLATTNKHNPNHWVKLDVVESGECQVLESEIQDNPHIDEDTINRYEKLLVGHWGKRMLLNQWAGAAGAIWQSLVVHRPLPRGRVRATIDVAQSGTTAALCVNQVGQKHIICEEYYHKGTRSFDDHAAIVASWKPEMVYCDPSSPGMIAAIRKKGIPCSPANNDVLKGIQTTDIAIRNKRILLEEGKAPNLQKEMASYIWDEKASMAGEDKPVKFEDHACDALRYYCMRHLPMSTLTPIQRG